MTNLPTHPECDLAVFATEFEWKDIPSEVRQEAKRSILNILATCFSGCRETAVETALAVMAPFSAEGHCSLIGRRERCDPSLAAFLNAMAANIFDYDDNHPNTIIHPSAPLAPPLFALAEHRGCSGQDLLRAFVLGGEMSGYASDKEADAEMDRNLQRALKRIDRWDPSERVPNASKTSSALGGILDSVRTTAGSFAAKMQSTVLEGLG